MATQSRKHPAPKAAGAPKPPPQTPPPAQDPVKSALDKATAALATANDRLAKLEKLVEQTAESVAATHLLFAALKSNLNGANATGVKAVQGAIDAAWANCTAALDVARSDWRKRLPWLMPVGLGLLAALSFLGVGRREGDSNIAKNWPATFPPSDTPEAT